MGNDKKSAYCEGSVGMPLSNIFLELIINKVESNLVIQEEENTFIILEN